MDKYYHGVRMIICNVEEMRVHHDYLYLLTCSGINSGLRTPVDDAKTQEVKSARLPDCQSARLTESLGLGCVSL